MQDEEIQKDLALLKGLMLSAFSHWAMLESDLGMLLQICISPQTKRLGFAAYFATDSFHSRLQVVDSVIIEVFDSEPHGEAALSAWRALFERVNSVKTVRNKFAHGVPRIQRVLNKDYARIVNPMWDIKSERKRTENQPYGLSANDMKDAIDKISRCRLSISAIVNIIQAARLKTHDTPTLQQICGELEGYLKTSNKDLPFDQILQKLSVPPPSSPA